MDNKTPYDDDIVKRPNYPKDRSPYKIGRRCFDWDGSEHGPTVKTALAVYCDQKKSHSHNLFSSRYALYGITAETTYAFVKRACPEFFEEYEARMGKPIAKDLFMKRIYMWWLKAVPSGGCMKVMTGEHPYHKTPWLRKEAEAMVAKAG